MNSIKFIHFIILVIFIFELSFIWPVVTYDLSAEYHRLRSHYKWITWEIFLPITIYSKKYGFTYDEICSVINIESRGNRFAESKSGARGLMQIMKCNYPNKFGDMYTIDKNIEIGCQYLRWCMSFTHNNFTKALRCYNAGPFGKKYNTAYDKNINHNIAVTEEMKKLYLLVR